MIEKVPKPFIFGLIIAGMTNTIAYALVSDFLGGTNIPVKNGKYYLSKVTHVTEVSKATYDFVYAWRMVSFGVFILSVLLLALWFYSERYNKKSMTKETTETKDWSAPK